ncbi:DNA repair protein recO [Spiroplasma sp. TIUS-1]|uniref:DNA repair protein RecO n=1 Tax=Spiroplasma sp. TIUS-1 TaxID=216963 RepID=UPI001396EF12|nr:DNA repair protein RecO [Spiroplasma sp. TIUS-1]QHX35971.1 DNA repair protein recO [Spiroplasma sp. TIUS-1]
MNIINGFVLNNFTIEDNKSLISVFSKENGLINLYAMGLQSERSKNKYSALKFSKSEFEIFQTKDPEKMSKLKTGKLNISIDISTISYEDYLYITTIFQVVEKTSNFGEVNQKKYKFIDDVFLAFVEDPKNRFVIFLYFMLNYLEYVGRKWNLVTCIKCRKRVNKFIDFDYVNKQFICLGCQNQSSFETDMELFIKTLEYFSHVKVGKIIKEEYDSKTLVKINRVLMDEYKNEVGLITTSIIELSKGRFV